MCVCVILTFILKLESLNNKEQNKYYFALLLGQKVEKGQRIFEIK